MNRAFLYAMGLVICLTASLVGYGIYVNYQGENNISDRISNRTIELKCSVVKEREIYPIYTLDEVTFYSDSMSDAVAKVEGTVIVSNIFKNKQVKAGDVLFTVSNEDIPLQKIQATSNLAKVNAQLKQAENTFSRYKELMELDATSKQKYDEAEANYHSMLAAVEEAEAQIKMAELMQGRLNIVSPIDGRVTIIYRGLGDYVQKGQAVCLIGDFDDMWFACNMQDEIIKKMVRNFATDKFDAVFDNGLTSNKTYTTEYGADNKGKSQNFPLVIDGIFPSLDVEANMRRVVWRIDNRTAMLEPRSYSDVEIRSGQKVKVLSVPVTAFVDSGRDVLYVVTTDGKLEQRKVVSGVSDENYVEILSGLNEGDIVVKTAVNTIHGDIPVKPVIEE